MGKLSREIVRVIVGGEAFHGEFTSEVMVAMHLRGLSTIRIASIFGIAQQAVTHRLYNYKRFYPERNYDLKTLETKKAQFKRLYTVEGLSVRQIADEFNLEFNTMNIWFKEIFPNGWVRSVIDMTQRHERLCRILFGVYYEPDFNFLDFILKEIELFDYDKDLITDYYIKGIENKESFERLRELHRWQKILSAKYQTATLIKEHVISERTSSS